MNKRSDKEMIDKNARTGLIVLAVVIGMTTLAFASVPLYNLFCRVTGFAGTTQIAAQLPDQVLEREVIVKFNADTAPQMPWIFKPDIRQVTVKIGERGLASFTAKNPADTPVAGTALYNVTPPKAGKYFHKVQCLINFLQLASSALGNILLALLISSLSPELQSNFLHYTTLQKSIVFSSLTRYRSFFHLNKY